MRQSFLIFVLFAAIFLISLTFEHSEPQMSLRRSSSNLRGFAAYYFYGEGCPHCTRAEPFIDDAEKTYGLNLQRFEVYGNRSNVLLLEEYFERHNVSTDQRGVPAIFTDEFYMVGDGPITERLDDFLINSKLTIRNDALVGSNQDVCSNTESKGIDCMSFIAISLAALVDSINPCSFAVLVFLIGARVLTVDPKKRALKVGLSFCLAVFVAYFLFGLGLLSFLQLSGFSGIFGLLVGFGAIAVGLVNLRGIFRWKNRVFTEVPQSWKPALRKLLKTVTSPIGAFAMGFVAACFELPCTGGPYLFILGQLANSATRMQAIPLLLYYNLIFVLPLICISLFLHSNLLSVGRVREWSENNKRLLRLIEGSVMVGLGLLVIPTELILESVFVFFTVFRNAGPSLLAASFLVFLVSFLKEKNLNSHLTHNRAKAILAASLLVTSLTSSPFANYLGARTRALFPSEQLDAIYDQRPAALAKASVPFFGDLVLTEDFKRSRYDVVAGSEGPEETQTSLFMIGTVSVSAIFLESNGRIDQQTENWSDARIADYVDRIQSGLDWLKSQEPKAHLNWTLHAQKIEVDYEPITRSQSDEGLWIDAAMSYLGYTTGDYHDRVTQYNNDLRNGDGTHWAYTIFVVDSLNDQDGAFSDGFSDYMAGPYIVMTYDNDGWGVENTNKAASHETAHVFGAEDEYSICSCIGTYGFLQVSNLNCTAGCPKDACSGGEPDCHGCTECYTSNCMMENLNWCLTVSTRYQLGWRDDDLDSILDAVDSTYNNWTDSDGDGVVDYADNCPIDPNTNQTDSDGDWIGDVCDLFPYRIDIAVTEVNLSKTVIGQSYPLLVNITVGNEGDVMETFNITLYANTTLVQELYSVSLSARSFVVLTLLWDTTAFTRGNYRISSAVAPILGEIDTDDNILVDGWVLVTIPGDIAVEYGNVDIMDIVTVAVAFNSKPNDLNWNMLADINNDGIVDIFDIVVVALHFGETG
jgi:cytochrome c biogenesis protein CcdA